VGFFVFHFIDKEKLEKIEGKIKNEKPRDTDNIGFTGHRTKTKKTQKHNTEN
jgi:hypothetical protein